MKNAIETVVVAWQRDNVVRNLATESIETYGASARDFLSFFAEQGSEIFGRLQKR